MNVKKTVFLCALPMLFWSCIDESPFTVSNSGKGKIELNITACSEISGEMPKVRSVSEEIVAPDASLFQIRLSSADGSYVKTWSSLAEFEKEESFSIGTYDLEAFYGSPSSQGIVAEGEEGHEHAYYYAINEEVKIESDKTTPVALEAKLANSVVIIEYTDAFKRYFKSWETTLKTDGAAQVALEDKECLAYIKSGNVNLTIKAELQNGNVVRMTPASFQAEPQHLYKIKYNINNGEIGEVDKLEIIFNDDIENEDNIEIDLTEELFTGGVPIVLLEGLEDLEGDVLEMLEGYPFEETVKFIINAYEGIKTVKLRIVTTDGTLPSFMPNGELDLMSLDEAGQAELSNHGIRCLGLFNNPDKLALIDITEVCRQLPVGSYDISLTVGDKYGREGEPASFKQVTCPVDLDLSLMTNEQGETGIVELGDREADVIVSYNGPAPSIDGPIGFKVAGNLMMEDVRILSIEEMPNTRGFDAKNYKMRISLPDADRDDYPVEITYNGVPVTDLEKNPLQVTIKVKYPDYEMEYDAMATRIMMRLNEDSFKNADIIKKVQKGLRIYVDGEEVSRSRIKFENDIWTIEGLEGSEHSLQTAIGFNEIPAKYSEETLLEMEEQQKVPNINFQEIDNDKAINISSIKSGGSFTVRYILTATHNFTSSIRRNVPKYWATVNDYTCFTNSNNKNTWFLVPSTYVEDGVVTIESVGYHHNGPEPTDPKDDTLYCPNKPSELFSKSGELFLGEYSYTGGYLDAHEERSDGIDFTSRPIALKFTYNYSSYQGETGLAEITILDENDNILSSGELYLKDTQTQNQEAELKLENYDFGVKASKLKILFKSTSGDQNPGINIPEGSALSEGISSAPSLASSNNKIIATNQYKAVAKGSVLKISNLSIEY